MKIIKFRAWNGVERRMIIYNLNIMNDCGSLSANFEDENFTELMQYTGLKDKNGKEIYEGDIIYQGDIVMGKIIFQEGGFKIDVNSKNQMPSQINQDRASHWEVIGNIYENPELFAKHKNE